MRTESFVSELEAHDYFRGLAKEKAEALKREFHQNGWMAIFTQSHRFYSADAEDLAEGGVCAFIREIQPFLSSQGGELPEIDDDISETGYVVKVAGVPHLIYDSADLERDADREELGLIWGLAMARGFAIVDHLLESAGSPERTYAISGGNDLSAIFLTPALHRIISAQPDSVAKDGPYRPDDKYPWFGQPHD